jgi:ABC-type amino acid transport substrate-binding protein
VTGTNRLAILFVIASLLGATACGGSSKPKSKPVDPGSTTIRLYASLDTNALSLELISGFEKTHQGLKVETHFVKTAELVQAVRDKLADIVLSTTPTVHSVTAAVQVPTDPVVIGWNVLVIAVAKGNPKKVVSSRAFGADKRTTSVLCDSTSLIGRMSQKVLKNLDIKPAPDLTVSNPQEALDDIVSGKADLTMVTRTTASARKSQIDVVEIYRKNVGTQYQAVAIETNPNPMKFLNYITTLTAKDHLLKLGYTPSRALGAS